MINRINLSLTLRGRSIELNHNMHLATRFQVDLQQNQKHGY